MIHGAFMEVTCDGIECTSSEWVELDFVYRDYSGKDGFYEHADGKIEEKLVNDHKWTVADSKQYCCDECMP